jgi:murein DD-endopeptidase MepM/ murein hydrolase activator NlpD
MKKTFLLTAITLASLMLNNLFFITSTIPGNAAPPPPTPTPITTPIAPTGIGQGNPVPPIPGEMPAQVEQARARQAMEAALAKYLRYWGPRYQVAPVEVTVESEWAHGVAKWQGQAKTLNGPIHILAHRLPDGTWQALLPGTDGLYLQWLEAMPERLMPASEKSQLRAQAAEAETLQRPQATPAVPQGVKKGTGKPANLAVKQMQPTVTPTPVLWFAGGKWGTYTSLEFGYSVRYPSTLQLREVKQYQNNGIPSDLWIGESIHIITRIPPLPEDAFLSPIWKSAAKVTLPQGIEALKLERLSEPMGGGTSRLTIEYLIRAKDADFFLIYDPPVPSDEERRLFEAIVSTFTPLPQRTYAPPVATQSVGALAAQTDGFDFPVDPRDGSSGRPPWYAGYNVQNPSLQNCGDSNGDGKDDCWSSCYNKWFSQLQHAGEDWFRSAGSNVYAIANGRVIWSDKNAKYPGGVIIIEHTLPPGVSNPWGGNLIYSMYGHLDENSLISQWADVKRGQLIGKVYNWGSNSHVHFEVRRYGNMQQAPEWVNGYHFCNTTWPGPGYTDTNAHPDWFGYTHPSNWIDGHRPGGGGGSCGITSVPSGYHQCAEEGGFCSFSGTADVIYGANSCYTSPRSFSNGTACNNDVFGDPLLGVHKYCYTNGSSGGGSWAYQLFDLGDYNGDKYESNQTITDLSTVGWNDRAESIKINSGYEIIACEHANFQGSCGRATGPAQFSDINALAQGLRNGLSSIKVCVGSCPNPPSAPSLISPSNGQYFNEGQGINLSWSATGNEYYGEVWGGPGGTLTFGWQSGTSKDIGPQWAGYTYSWHVKARNDAGTSDWSSTWTFTVKPAAPSNLSAQTASCSQVNLYWTDNSGNEEGYKIYRNGSYVGQVGMNATSYQDTGLNGNTSYSYYVRAFRGSIESDTSNTVNITTPPCAQPLPDLRPYAPSGYPYPVVPSSVQGTHTVNTLYAGQITYFDWFFTNSGGSVAPGTFYVELWVDSTCYVRYPQPDFYLGWVGGFDDWAETISTPGWHTVRLVTDPDNTVAESDENNNVWEMQFYWTPSAPFYRSYLPVILRNR